MKSIFFATTNKSKLQIARTVCKENHIKVESVALDIDEIQGEDPELIIRDKAKRAYELLGNPVVVSDDSWDIRALNGFPGPYMKSINYWFKPKDYLRLMHGVKDRHIVTHQYLAYTDGKMTKVFKNDIEGQIIEEARGKNDKYPIMTVTVLDSDNGKTIAEALQQSTEAIEARYKNRRDAWHNFAEWYKDK